MKIQYDISEQDFMDAQHLAVKNSPMRIVRWSRLVLPLFGLALLAFLIYAVAQQGLSWRVIPASLPVILLLSIPLLNNWYGKQVYAKTTSMHGTLSLEADDSGLQLQGQTFASRIQWVHFCKFLEDEKSFLLYQNPQVFNIVPKRSLAPEQIETLRLLLKQHISRAA